MSDASEICLPASESVVRLGDGVGHGRLRCGIMHTTAQDRRTHDVCTPEYALVYIAHGEGSYTDADGETRLCPGHLVQRLPERPHRMTVVGGRAFCQCYLAVPRPLYDALVVTNAFPRRPAPVLWLGLQQGIIDRYQAVIDDIRQRSARELYVLLPRLSQFIIDLLALAGGDASPAPDELVTRACEVLGRDLARRLPLPALAADLGVSYSRFRKLFRAATGVAPGAYRIRRRIERSQELLCAGVAPKAVAEELGYPDVYAFSKQFRRVTGQPPAAFQQAMRV